MSLHPHRVRLLTILVCKRFQILEKLVIYYFKSLPKNNPELSFNYCIEPNFGVPRFVLLKLFYLYSVHDFELIGL